MYKCVMKSKFSTARQRHTLSCAVASLESLEDAIVGDRIVSDMQVNSLRSSSTRQACGCGCRCVCVEGGVSHKLRGKDELYQNSELRT